VSGILGGPIDLGGKRRGQAPRYPEVEAHKGLTVRHRTSGVVGTVVAFSGTQVKLRSPSGREQAFPVADGAFSVEGSTVTLIRPRPATGAPGAQSLTASGSIAVPGQRARVARASRILVEGLHDAELVEKVWGDDLRVEGVVVEPLHGADDLGSVVAEFEPGPGRRLGVLLDHLVTDTKEWRLARTVDHPDVLITGHPFVDVWQAIRPATVGIPAWPTVPRGTDWKTGICAALGFRGTPAELWRQLLGQVGSYRDLEPALVGAVEQLIDFVAPPPLD
jgi:Protein of unknown function (DUF3097)